MAFTQSIVIDGVSDEHALQNHVAGWNAEQAGVAPGYLGARVFADQGTAGRYLIEVDFSSQEEAERNNAREETASWAAGLRQLAADSTADYRNLRQVCTTYR